MGFLKKNKAPGELPDLAVGDPGNSFAQAAPQVSSAPKPIVSVPVHPTPQAAVVPEPVVHHVQTTPVSTSSPAPIKHPVTVTSNVPQVIANPTHPPISTPQEFVNVGKPKIEVHKKEIAGENYLEFETIPSSKEEAEEIKKQIAEQMGGEQNGFFNRVLDDINGEIKDLGKLEEWYKNKFLPQDVVSNMRLYWEDNKADMIIRSFGGEYKQKINEHIKHLQELEADWREIYFKLIKKEEEMKKEERILKDTLSDFVDLCKRRKSDNEKESKE